jgi:hypothetical protein
MKQDIVQFIADFPVIAMSLAKFLPTLKHWLMVWQ